MGLQPIYDDSQEQENKELTNTDNNRLQTSLQTNPENSQNPADNLPPELLSIIKVWPELPEHIKQAIKALIDTHTMKE